MADFDDKIVGLVREIYPEADDKVMNLVAPVARHAYAAGLRVASNEYEICQRRGHASSGRNFSNARHTWTYCKWCNTPYRWTEPQMVED